MDQVVNKEIKLLTMNEVYVVTKTTVIYDGVETVLKQVGDVYKNTPSGRALLQNEDTNIKNCALAYWGDTIFEDDVQTNESESEEE